MEQLFEKHKALFMDGIDGDIYPTLFDGYEEKQLNEVFNDFFVWNASCDMNRKWIAVEGPFRFKYE